MKDAVQAVGLELGGGPPKLVYYGAEDPHASDAPVLVVVDYRGRVEGPGGPVEVPFCWPALKRAVGSLLQKKPVPWMVETHSTEDFQRQWLLVKEDFAARIRHAEEGFLPVLLHIPPRQGRALDLVGSLSRVSEMLELIEPSQAGPVVAMSRTDKSTPALPPAGSGSSKEDDPERAVDLARPRREELLRGETWLTAGDVHARLGGAPGAPGANNRASRLRKGGELLGVWEGGRFLYPVFQFYPDNQGGQLIPAMTELLKVLPSDAEDPSGWRKAFWLFQHHAGLENGQRPADFFRKDPQAVIRAARSTFAGGDDHW